MGRHLAYTPTNARLTWTRLRTFCPNTGCSARGHATRGDIKIHCRERRRYRCTECKRTFSERTGTPFLHLNTVPTLVVLVLTLIAYGCPVPAIEAAFGFDRRTARAWILKAGTHSRAVHGGARPSAAGSPARASRRDLCPRAVARPVALPVLGALRLDAAVARRRGCPQARRASGPVAGIDGPPRGDFRQASGRPRRTARLSGRLMPRLSIPAADRPPRRPRLLP